MSLSRIPAISRQDNSGARSRSEFWHLLGCLTEDLQVADDRVLDHRAPEERIPARLGVGEHLVDGLADVQQVDALVLQSATASSRTRSRMYGDRLPSVRTSTSTPRLSSRSLESAIRSKRLRPSAISTRRSRSLDAPCSPRPTEPKDAHVACPMGCSNSTHILPNRRKGN